MNAVDVASLLAASSLAELCWVGTDGAPRVRGVIALAREARPALAFTYADHALAREVAAAERVALALTERRSTGEPFRPTLLTGTPWLDEDPTGDLFAAELLTQELRRYPPSRLFADSPLLMREYWWYLPRLVVGIDVAAVEPVPARESPLDHLLVVAEGATPVVRVAGVVAEEERRLELAVEGRPAPAGAAVLFGQDASFPDLERWSQWRWTGRWDGSRLAVEEAPPSTGLGPPLGLVQRWRRQRTLQRRCVEALPQP